MRFPHTLTRWEIPELPDPPLSVITDEYSAAAPSAGISNRRPLKRGSLARGIKGLLVFALLLWVADAGIGLLIHYTALQDKLTSRLSGAFGRPVEVGRYNFSIWTGPTLEAQSVIVSEDPRFGYEYFLRSESLRVRLRWQSLLRGRVELGALLLRQPSLNLVRNAEGDWNLAEWLPRPVSHAPPGAPANSPTAGASSAFERIDIDSGRINFKRADEKLPFAFVNVNGTAQADGPGRWRINMAATPWRAALVTQQAGSIYVAGHLGGTSSRLLPAVLESSWTDASISDALRLIRGDDYGVRGSLDVVLSANTGSDGWKLQARAQMRQLHRWDLSLRPDNPALNLIAQMKIGLDGSALELTSASLEAPRSYARATGRFLWNDAGPSRKNQTPPLSFTLSDFNIDATDILAWVRAFHPGVAGDIAIHGTAKAGGVVLGWPPHIDTAKFVTTGLTMQGPALPLPVHLSALDLDYDYRRGPGRLSLSPFTVFFQSPTDPSAGSFRIDKVARARSNSSSWRLAGSMQQVRDLIAVAGSLGWNLSRGFDLAGFFRCDVRWPAQQPQGTLAQQMPWAVPSSGFIELGGPDDDTGGSLRPAFLNHPVEQIKARADWKPGIRHIALSSAQALGTQWSGTFDRRDSDDQWQFVLSADRMAASDVDLWINPRWRESLIDRMLPFLNTRSTPNAVPENLRAAGRLTIDQLILAPVAVRHLQGDVALTGRHFEFTDATGQFYGGAVSGMFITDLKTVPTYQVNADFSNVDLRALSAASPGTADLFSGVATGQVFFTSHGSSRSDIVSSLQCRGSADVEGPQLRDGTLPASVRDAVPPRGATLFHDASAAFTCANRKIQFHDFALVNAADELDAAGSVDFSRNLDFRLTVMRDSPPNPSATPNTPAPGVETYQLTGTLASPQLARISAVPHRPR
jgi:AsmA-like C-terminal region/AsmA family